MARACEDLFDHGEELLREAQSLTAIWFDLEQIALDIKDAAPRIRMVSTPLLERAVALRAEAQRLISLAACRDVPIGMTLCSEGCGAIAPLDTACADCTEVA